MAEIFRPSKEVKEAIPAGSKYRHGKTAAQFYGGLLKEVQRRAAVANERIEAYRATGRKMRILEDEPEGKHLEIVTPSRAIINISLNRPLSELAVECRALAELLAALNQSRASKAILANIAELNAYEENDANKQGIAELQSIITANDDLLAASLSEDKR
ncbi:MAG: hypothetical protein PHV99_03695 [Candidatus Pacebacteria bacterium]|nr:hypothetical protein [Candidatus Paceibacterota bacterium]